MLEQIHRQLTGDTAQPSARLDSTQPETNLKGKEEERARVLALFRRGRITDAELDAQLDEIGAEEEGLRRSLAELGDQEHAAARTSFSLRSLGALLKALRQRLEEGVSWELNRELIEILVGQIRVEGAHQD